MVTFTRHNGTTIEINAGGVIRARRRVYGEPKTAKSRIDDADGPVYVMESVSVVAERISAENANFTFLNTRDGSEIWFDATKADGPFQVIPMRKEDGYNSSIKLMRYRQYVTQTHAQVIAVLSAAGGQPRPDPDLGPTE